MNMPRWKWMALGLAGLAFAGCGSDSADSDDGPAQQSSSGVTSAKVALVNDVTGALSFVGTQQRRAAELAIEDVNQSDLGVKLEAVKKDSKSAPAGAVSAMQSVVGDSDVVAAVGFDSTELGQAVMPVVEQSGIPTIMLQVTSLENRPDNVFSMGPPTSRVAKLAIDEVVAKRGVKTAAIVYQEQPTLVEAAETFKTELEASGVKVVGYEGASLKATNFDQQITKILADNPDAVGVSGLSTTAGTMIAALGARGYKGLIFAQQAAASPVTRKVAGKAYDGVVIGTYWDPAAANDQAQRFIDAWTKAYPKDPPPDVFATEAWDAIHILAQALKETGSTDKGELTSAISSGTFSGALQDSIGFGQDGFATLEGYVIEMQPKGAKVLVEPGT